MKLRIVFIFFVACFTILIGCTERTHSIQAERSLEFSNQENNTQIDNRTSDIPISINNAWGAVSTVFDTTTSTQGSLGLSQVSNKLNTLFASWTYSAFSSDIYSQLASDLPWKKSEFDQIFQAAIIDQKLYSNPQSDAVFATWVNPYTPLNTGYVSRYTAASGWSPSIPYANADALTEVITGQNGEALLLWLNYANDGTVELHSRMYDNTDQLQLMDTYTIGEAGLISGIVDSIDGWITDSGDIELYWISSIYEKFANGKQRSNSQLWRRVFTKDAAGIGRWSKPEKIVNGLFQLDFSIDEMSIVPDANGDLMVVVQPIRAVEPTNILTLSRKADIWGMIESLTTNAIPYDDAPAIAHNANGEIAITWLQQTQNNSSGAIQTETQIMVMQYHPDTGWASPIQINSANISPVAVSGTGKRPVISMNSAGQIAVAWMMPAEDFNNIYANHFDPSIGWSGEERAIVGTLNKSQREFSIHLNKRGEVSLLVRDVEIVTGSGFKTQITAASHFGVGNGIANAIPTRSLDNSLLANSPLNQLILTSNTLNNKKLNFPVLPQQRKKNILNNINPIPISISSAWDEPVLIDSIISPYIDGMYIMRPLQVTNDNAGNLFSYFLDTNNASYTWTGNAFSGGWQSPAFLNAPELFQMYIVDTAIDPGNGDTVVSWTPTCSEIGCTEVFVSRKNTDNIWDIPLQLSRIDGIFKFVTNAKNISAVWVTTRDAAKVRSIAYSSYDPTSGWSVPDFYTPSMPGGLSTNQLVVTLDDSGVLSILAEMLADNNRTTTNIFIQRLEAGIWAEELFPTKENLWDRSAILASTTIAGEVIAVISKGNGLDNLKTMSYVLKNGLWQVPEDITLPKKGNVYSWANETPKDSNNSGQILVAWYAAAETAVPFLQVRANYYDPATGWGKVADVSLQVPVNNPFIPLPGPRLKKEIDLLTVSINEAGQGAIAWIDNSGTQLSLNIVHLEPNLTGLNQEVVAVLDPTVAFFDGLALHVDDLGRATLTWNERTIDLVNNTHRIKTTTHHNAGAIEPPPLVLPIIPTPTLPSTTGGWSEAETVLELNDNLGWPDLVRVPEISSNNSIPLISIQIDRQFDFVTKQFDFSYRSILNSPIPGVWIEDKPFGGMEPDVMSEVRYANDDFTQATYALWKTQNQLFLQHKIGEGIWGAPVSIEIDVENAWLFSNTLGQVLMAWQTIGNLQTIAVSEVFLDAAGEITHTMPAMATTPNSQLAGKPVFNNQGMLAALTKVPNNDAGNIQVLIYQFGLGWRTSTGLALDATGFELSTLQFTISSENQVLVFAKSLNSLTLYSAIVLASDNWSRWVKIQDNDENLARALVGKFRIGTSDIGDVYAMWVEEFILPNGVNTHIQFSRYRSENLITGFPWSKPYVISAIQQPVFNETPNLLVAASGSAAIIWNPPYILPEIGGIFVQTYTPSNGWLTEAEIANSYYSKDTVSDLNANLSASGDFLISWRLNQGKSKIMTTRKVFQ